MGTTTATTSLVVTNSGKVVDWKKLRDGRPKLGFPFFDLQEAPGKAYLTLIPLDRAQLHQVLTYIVFLNHWLPEEGSI